MSKHSKSKQALRYLAAQAAIALGVMGMHPIAAAEPIFKCGKTYTNVPPGARTAQLRPDGCVLLDAANQPKAKTTNIAVDGSRQITVPVGKDGRFWVPGTVNGFPVQFVIYKSAAVNAGVAVTEDFAARANLIGGAPAHMQTTGAVMEARRIERVPMTFGPFSVPQATVVVGSLGRKSTDALLGQELLSLFDVTANDRELTIVGR